MHKQKTIFQNINKCAVVCSVFPDQLRKKFTSWFTSLDTKTQVRFFKTDKEANNFLIM
jgi:hypothetical protein